MLFADLLADFFHGLVNVIVHRPVFATVANAVDEIGNDFLSARACGRLRDEIAGRKISARGFQSPRIRNFSVMATGLKPSGILVSLSPWEFQTCNDFGNFANSAQLESLIVSVPLPYSRLRPFSTFSAQKVRKQLHAKTDAQHRHAKLKNIFVRQWCVLGIDAGWAAR